MRQMGKYYFRHHNMSHSIKENLVCVGAKKTVPEAGQQKITKIVGRLKPKKEKKDEVVLTIVD